MLQPSLSHDLESEVATLGARRFRDGGTWSDAPEFQSFRCHVSSLRRVEDGTDDVSLLQGMPASDWNIGLMNGREVRVTIPAGANAAILCEEVAKDLNKQWDDHDSHPNIHPSQVKLIVDSVPLEDYTMEIPEDAEVRAIVNDEQHWTDIARGLPHDIFQFATKMGKRELLLLEEEDKVGLWRDAGEWGPLVNAIAKLCKRDACRGSTSELCEVDEILEVLEVAIDCENASPASVLAKLNEEFEG